MKSIGIRALLISAILIVGIVFLVPSFTSTLPPGWSKVLPTEKIRLGLDLQGGIHLVLEVEADKAVENAAERFSEEIKDVLRAQKIGFTKVARANKWDVEVVLPSAEQQNEMNQAIQKDFPRLKPSTSETTAEGSHTLLTIDQKEVNNIRSQAIAQGLETIRNRIDQFGVREPDIRPEGEDRILVQLPGISNPQEAINLIGKTAVLEFKLVAQNVTDQDMRENKLPAGVRVYPMRPSERSTRGESKIALEDKTLLTGQYITDARVEIGSRNFGESQIALEFDAQGARVFERVTGEHVNRQLAIVLDGVVYSAPNIKERISGGRAVITGSFTDEEAKVLAIALRTGRLPAPVKILEQRTVGPALGLDSITKGILASAIGGLGIIIFMVVYYRFSGVIADFALAINILLLLASMAIVGATLTLPGIAGIALTIGMAVDANVLIYERIREELRLGKTPRASVETGYGRATTTILDANVTTIIAALVLYQFGTGPIKGFAVTLSIGLVANLFTAIFVTRVIFDYLLTERRVKELSI
ncbi:MAG: protein translocase subunit SecD [Desulfobacteraceae bacterium]|nr:protein translocase subunit SecD [Desulfobacteraceae bacterium]